MNQAEKILGTQHNRPETEKGIVKKLLTILYSGFTAYWAAFYPNFPQKKGKCCPA